MDSSQKKLNLLRQLLATLGREREVLAAAIEVAVEGATHEQSKPENKYDTRALEASYLAGAQQERLNELNGVITHLESISLMPYSQGDAAGPTAVIELDSDGARSSCFLLPFAAGYSLKDDEGRLYKTVTVQSPLGQSLLGRRVGDFIEVAVGGYSTEYEVVEVW